MENKKWQIRTSTHFWLFDLITYFATFTFFRTQRVSKLTTKIKVIPVYILIFQMNSWRRENVTIGAEMWANACIHARNELLETRKCQNWCQTLKFSSNTRRPIFVVIDVCVVFCFAPHTAPSSASLSMFFFGLSVRGYFQIFCWLGKAVFLNVDWRLVLHQTT